MKEIEEGIHEVHARAREQKNNEKENQEDKEMTGKGERGLVINYKYLEVKTFLSFKVDKQ